MLNELSGRLIETLLESHWAVDQQRRSSASKSSTQLGPNRACWHMLAHTATQTALIGEGPRGGWQMANAGGSGCEPEISPSIWLWHFSGCCHWLNQAVQVSVRLCVHSYVTWLVLDIPWTQGVCGLLLFLKMLKVFDYVLEGWCCF